MYARLSKAYGWHDGTGGFLVLREVERYAGMMTGRTITADKVFARPLSEFEALSVDGEEWHPTANLLALVPWETSSVQVRDLSLPVALDQDQDGFL